MLMPSKSTVDFVPFSDRVADVYIGDSEHGKLFHSVPDLSWTVEIRHFGDNPSHRHADRLPVKHSRGER